MDTPAKEQPLRPAALVRSYLPAIIASCEADPTGNELADLLDSEYSKATFGLGKGLAFFRLVDGPTRPKHYAATKYPVGPDQVWLTQEWFDKHVPMFLKFLVGKHLVTAEEEEELAAQVATTPSKPTSGKPAGKALYPYKTVGDVHNTFTRNVLSRLRETEINTWAITLDYFDHRCAYCRRPAHKLQKDHVYSLNQEVLGEHRMGNLVPACGTCNSKKDDINFRDWLPTYVGEIDAAERITAIDRYMRTHAYVPLGESPGFDTAAATQLIKNYRAILQELSDQCVEELQALMRSAEQAGAEDLGMEHLSPGHDGSAGAPT